MRYQAEQACFITYQQKLEDMASIVTIISCVVSSISFILKCFDAQSFKFPGRLATTATLLSVLFSFTMLIGTVTSYKIIDSSTDTEPYYANLCLGQAIVFQFISVALTFHWSFIGYVTYLVVVARYSVRSFKKLEMYLSLGCWAIAFILTFLPIAVSGLEVYGPSSGLTVCYLQACVHNKCFFFFF
jgi:hypothetical protein